VGIASIEIGAIQPRINQDRFGEVGYRLVKLAFGLPGVSAIGVRFREARS